MKLSKPQTKVLREIADGYDPYGRNPATNRMIDKLTHQGLLSAMCLTDAGKAALALAEQVSE
jgi:hypothetical protein